jgi:antitoxin YefM
MLSLDDYESLQETAYLLRSPANAKRLFDAIEAAEKGNLIEKSLSDLEE